MLRSAIPSFAAPILVLVAGAFAAVPAAGEGTDGAPAAIERLLRSRCGTCHDDAAAKGGLSLASAAGLLAGGDSGPAVVPGDPASSLLIAAVGYDDDRVRMPPDGKLGEAEIASLVAWVASGAPWPDGPAPVPAVRAPHAPRAITDGDRAHWAFLPVRDVEPPANGNVSWARGPIDRFVLAGIEAAGLAPAAAADKRTLLRRATFDLTGLPPTPEEIGDFLADESPGAFERVIDRLLASPRYGERWGRHWLDVVRYADARDLIQLPPESDFREAWRYRDWVIDSFNHDLPYVDFLSRQIAGDLLQPDDPSRIDADALVATGFLAIADFVPGDVDKERMIFDCVNDQIDVVGRAFLGLSLACARCHDHKFDPVSTDDYHALAGIFLSSRVIPGPVKGNTPLVRVPLLPAADVAAIEARAAADRKRLEALRGSIHATREREHLAALERLVVSASAADALAAWDLRASRPDDAQPDVRAMAASRHLDEAALTRWVALLDAPPAPLRALAAAGDRSRAAGIVASMAATLAAEAAGRQAARTATRTTADPVAEVLRLRADDERLVTDPTGSVVAWPDGDGLPDDARPADGIPAPTLGRSLVGGRERAVVRFDGASILRAAREVPPVGALSVLFRPADDDTPGQRLVGWEDAAVGQHGVGLIVGKSGALHAVLRRSGSSGDVVVDAEDEVPVFRLVTVTWGPGGTRVFRDGREVGANGTIDSVSSSPDIGALRVGGAGSGAGPSFRGDLLELRVHAGALDDAARRRVEAEMQARWLGEGPPAGDPSGAELFDALAGPGGPYWRPPAERDAWLEAAGRARIEGLLAERDGLEKAAPVEIPRAVVVQEGGVPGTRHEGFHDAAIAIRGNPANRGHVVPRGFPRILVGDRPPAIGGGSGRRELAAWLADPAHPLTARVMVNRIWQHHFGAGIVPVEGGFGRRGGPPSHPALLDHLAARFVASGWSVKAMHRMIMSSSTYRQASAVEDATRAADPDNRLLSRMPRRRLESEAIRDAMLAVSGRLDPTPGGPAFGDLATPRRSVYLQAARTGGKTAGFGLLFDAADCGAIVENRKTSIVAPQALFLLNDPFVLDLAAALATRVAADRPGPDPTPRLERLHERLFARLPTADERTIAERFLAGAGDEGWTDLCHLLLCTNEFVHVD